MQQHLVISIANTSVLQWQAPMDDSVKVNCDAAVDKNKWKMGISVIIRDRMGEVLATLSTPKDYIIDPNLAEAMTSLKATTFYL